MNDEPTPRRRGRPPGRREYNPVRTAGRIGALWDEAAQWAEAAGESMTKFVEKALKREIAVRKAQKTKAARAANTTTEETR